MSCDQMCEWCESGQHRDCDGRDYLGVVCRCDDGWHDGADDDGDTQWMDPGEAGGYEGATW